MRQINWKQEEPKKVRKTKSKIKRKKSRKIKKQVKYSQKTMILTCQKF